MGRDRNRAVGVAAGLMVGSILGLSGLMPVGAEGLVRWAILGRVEPIHLELAKRFEAEHHINVEILPYSNQTELLDVLLDKKPDILTVSTKTAVEYIDMGILADVRPYLKGKDDFSSEVMTQFGKNFSKRGKVYALPFWGSLSVLNYNKELFSASGQPEPQPNWKYENEFYGALRKLTRDVNGDKKPEQYGMVGGVHNQWLPVFYSWGSEFLSGDGLKLLFTDKSALESLTYLQKLHKENLVEVRDPEAEFEPARGPFVDFRTAMFMDDRIWTDAHVKSLGSSRKMDLGSMSTPVGKKGAISVATSSAIGLYVQATNRQGAADFLKYLFEIDTQILMYREGGGFPTRKNVFKMARIQTRKDGKADDPLATSYEKARVMGADEISQLILDNVKYGVYEMVHQGWTPAQIIQQAKDEFYKMLKRNKE